MSLIIAIEPDRDQAAQLKDLVRRHTGAELILTDTTAHAINAIEQRVPDLVLIPALMSPEDDEALTTALRDTEDAKHVQTLTIPVLGTPQPKSLPQGVLSRLRGQSRPSGPDSCEPRLFAEQITEYLQRIAHDRGHGPAGNGNGSAGAQASSQAGSQGGSRKVKAAPPVRAPKAPPALVEKREAVAEPPRVVAPAPIPTQAPAPTPTPQARAATREPSASEPDLSALEAALAEVPLEEPTPEAAEATDTTAPAQAPSAAEPDALEQGLSSLLDRLGNDDWIDEPLGETAKDRAVVAPPVAAPPPKSTPAIAASSALAAPPDPAQWAQLKQLESLEYAMPKIVPKDEPAKEPARPAAAPPQAAAPKPPAPPSPAANADPAPKPAASEWGDLLDSLKKDLGK